MIIRRAQAADSAGIAKVHVDCWKTTYQGVIPKDYLSNLSYTQRERMWNEEIVRDQHLIYVAEIIDGEIVGFVSGGEERLGNKKYRSEMYAIYILKEWQRAGIGRKLTATLAKNLLLKGFDSMLLWVLAENPSRFFYENLGAKKLFEKQIEIGGKDLIEIAYGWEDINSLTKNCSRTHV